MKPYKTSRTGVICCNNPKSKYIVVYNYYYGIFLYLKEETDWNDFFKIGDIVEFECLTSYGNFIMPLGTIHLHSEYKYSKEHKDFEYSQYRRYFGGYETDEAIKLIANKFMSNTREIFNIEDFIFEKHKELWNYIRNLDLEKIFNTLHIEVNENHLSRIGEDEYFYIIKESKIDTDDIYIKSLFPFLGNKILVEICDFAGWRDIRERYYRETQDKIPLGVQTDEINISIKQAREKYDPELHHAVLLKNKIKEVFNRIILEYNIEVDVEKNWPINSLSDIISKLDDIELKNFANLYNKTVTNFENITEFDPNVYNKFYRKI